MTARSFPGHYPSLDGILAPLQIHHARFVSAKVGRYGEQTFGREQAIVPAWPWRQVSIRILVP